MSKENLNADRKTDQIAYSVKNTPDVKSYFNRVGAVWNHKNG